jgi:hypothetical protein
MATTHAPDLVAPRTDTERQESMFDQVVTPRTLNMIALSTAILWLLGMLSSLTRVADSAEDPAAWDYVVATNESTGFLVVTVLALVGAALIGALSRD